MVSGLFKQLLCLGIIGNNNGDGVVFNQFKIFSRFFELKVYYSILNGIFVE